MNKFVRFCGVLGLVFLLFGVIIYQLLQEDDLHLTVIHLIAGLVLLSVFTLGGGLRLLNTTSARRALGFGAGVTVYSALFIGVLTLVNYFAIRHEFVRIDTTEQKVYTLAPQTVSVLNELEQPVLARCFFVGGKIDPKVEGLLNRMKQANSKFDWVVIDPEKERVLIEQLGINEASTIHLGFTDADVSKKDNARQSKVIGKIGEQELVNGLLKLTRGGSKVLYFVTGHGEADLNVATEGGFQFLKESIEGENLTLKPLVLLDGDAVPADAAALLLLAPRKTLLPAEIDRVSSYLTAGGSALFLNEANATQDIATIVKPLGIEVGNDIIVAPEMGLFSGPSMGVQPMVTHYGIHPVTESFTEGTLYSTVTSVTKGATVPPGSKVTELAFTNAKSWAERDVAQIFSKTPTAAFDDRDLKGPVSIAAAYETEPAEGAKASRVLVIGDADFVANVNIRQLFNRDFFLNAVNWVAGEAKGVSIRERTLRGSMKRITDEQFLAMFLLTAVIAPELFLAGGLAVWFFRKK